MKTFKKIPEFKSKIEEAQFWEKNDVTEYFDFSKAKKVKFANLKPTTKLISIRLPEYLLLEIKSKANRLDIPYQSLIKLYLAEAVQETKKEKTLTKSRKAKINS